MVYLLAYICVTPTLSQDIYGSSLYLPFFISCVHIYSTCSVIGHAYLCLSVCLSFCLSVCLVCGCVLCFETDPYITIALLALAINLCCTLCVR